jgi:peptidoglycan/xylan/chitin deacetylase (PgdA/CDA1 family)
MTSSPILMYHQIVPGRPEDIHAVTIKSFADQMRWLHDHEYQCVTVEELLLDRVPVPSKPNSRILAISFDDGYLDLYTNALPILQQFSFKASIFLVSERIGKVNDWDQAPGLAGAPLLDWHHIHEMVKIGMSFGAHTCTHPDLTTLPVSQAAYEIQFSRKILEQELQQFVRVFAYPNSQYNEAIVKLVADSGYDLACTYVPHYVGGSGKRQYELQRTGILATDNLESFIGKVQARPRWRLRKLWNVLRKLPKN